jgi:hypothetical protein
MGLTTPCKKKIVEKPRRNSAGFCGGGQGLSWAVEPRKEEEEYQNSPLSTILSQIHPFPIFATYLPKIHLKIVLPSPSSSSKWTSPKKFTIEFCMICLTQLSDMPSHF